MGVRVPVDCISTFLQSPVAEADMDEFRAGIHSDRGFGSDFRNVQTTNTKHKVQYYA